jgi:hypothetical protein
MEDAGLEARPCLYICEAFPPPSSFLLHVEFSRFFARTVSLHGYSVSEGGPRLAALAAILSILFMTLTKHSSSSSRKAKVVG